MNIMKRLKLSFLVGSVWAALVATSSYAATECLGTGSTVQQISCFVQKQKEAESVLNDTYQRLIPLSTHNFDPELENDLRSAERAWLEFRKLNCQFYDRKDRALHGFEAADCMLRMTRERAAELKAAVEDLSNR
jgi:uncharacterized protein YecT (DUF1311 family)